MTLTDYFSYSSMYFELDNLVLQVRLRARNSNVAGIRWSRYREKRERRKRRKRRKRGTSKLLPDTHVVFSNDRSRTKFQVSWKEVASMLFLQHPTLQFAADPGTTAFDSA